MQDQNELYRFDLQRALVVVRRRWWLTALCVIAVAGAAFGFSKSQQNQYTATASLLLRDGGLAQNLLTTLTPPTVDPTREAVTNIKVISSPEVAVLTARALQKPVGYVSKEVSASAQGQTNVVSVQATDPDPTFAAALANTYAQRAIALAQTTDRSQVLQAQAALQGQLNAFAPAARNRPNGRLLQSRIQQLKLFASADTGNVQVLQQASIPTAPSAPRTKRNVLLAALFGLLLGLGAAALAERLSRRITASEELGDIHRLPVLVDVPKSRALKRGRDGSLPHREREAFRMLRARLVYSNLDRQIRSVLLTSAGVKEGKSTVAWHLAEAAAVGGQRVLLIEADMRAPVFAHRYRLEARPGLADVLEGRSELGDAIQRVALASTADGADAYGVVDVIVGGTPPAEPAALIESGLMAELLDRVTTDYDLTVLDAGPGLLVADAIPLVSRVGAVLVVGRVGLTTRDQASRLAAHLRALNAPTLGLIANGVRRGSGEQYGYYSGAERHQPPLADASVNRSAAPIPHVDL